MSKLVFDNRMAKRGGELIRGSRILSVDPLIKEARVVYEATKQEPFYTYQMGKQQQLGNGNILISEPMAGRIFEVDQQGNTVWEYINRWSDTEVAMVSEAIRIPEQDWTGDATACAQQ